MGYESRLYIVEAPHLDEDGKPFMEYKGAVYCRNVAEFDLSKVGYQNALSDLFSASIKAERERIRRGGWKHSIYETAEGNTQYTEDRYDDPLSPVPLDALVDCLRERVKRENYRRYPPLLALLEVFAKQVADGAWGPRGLLVLHFGY